MSASSGAFQARIPTTIVTGFLGSGKTTLLRHILEHAQGRRIAVIVNEFGELGVDGEILRGCAVGCADDDAEEAGRIYELANGCLCCTVQEAFYPVMQALMDRRDEIDHILIETSGLALPKPLVQAFNWPAIRTGCTVDAVITVVDVPAVVAGQFAADPAAVDRQRLADPNLDHVSGLHELFEDQLSAADLVLLNKADLVDQAALQQVQALVRREIPPQVKVVAGAHGRLDLALLLGLGCASEEGIHRRQAHHHHHDGDEGPDHDHAHEYAHGHDRFDSIAIELPAVDRGALLEGLKTLVRDHDILRIKGFAYLPDKPMRLVIQGVGNRFDSYFDRRWQPDETRGTRLVCIGRGLSLDPLQAVLASATVSDPV